MPPKQSTVKYHYNLDNPFVDRSKLCLYRDPLWNSHHWDSTCNTQFFAEDHSTIDQHMQHSLPPAGYTKNLAYIAGNQCFIHSSQSQQKKSGSKLIVNSKKNQELIQTEEYVMDKIGQTYRCP